MTSEVFFTEQKNGYDKTQVDNYIRKLTEAYQTAYAEYVDICGKYNALIQDCEKIKKDFLESDRQKGVNVSAIARTVMESERLAQEIIDNAYSEEARIIDRTKKNVEYAYKTIGLAMNEVQKFLTLRNTKESGGMLNVEAVT